VEIAIQVSGRGSGVAGAQVTRHVLGEAPLVAGRAWHCALHLPDPTVDAEHLAIGVQADGRLWVQDLGSTNGTRLEGRTLPAHTQRQIESGSRLTIGRCDLAIYRQDHAVAPAARPGTADQLKARLQQAPVWLALTLLGFLAVHGIEYLGYGDDYEPQVLLGSISGFLLAPALWAGFWGVINKLVRGEFNFLPHWCIGVAGVALVGVLEELLQLVGFNWHSRVAYRWLDAATTAALIAIALYITLSLATHLGRAAKGLATAVPVALLILTGYALPALNSSDRVSSPQLLALSRPPAFKVVPSVPPSRWLAQSSALFEQARDKAAEQIADEQAEALKLARRSSP
jgi:hypothetical protein